MPLFISDGDLARHSGDSPYVAAKADEFIRSLQAELESVRAQADAASITAEQTCSLLEQKFLSLSTEFSKLESQNAQLQSSLDDHLSELAQAQAQKHQLSLQSIGRDGEIERLTMELSELHKSRRQLIETVEQKDLQISEKNATINSYLDKIVKLTESAAHKEARLCETEAELARSKGSVVRLSQEKELIERHNSWLDDQLSAKTDSLMELHKTHNDVEQDLSTKLANAEKQFKDCSGSLKWNEERVKELEIKLASLQEEFLSSKDTASANEERYSAELSTANKLVELYKESSEEWSRKAGELEGVIKALETHLSQVENDYKERLEKEVSSSRQLEKEAADLKDKLKKFEAEVEAGRKANELNLVPLSSFTTKRLMDSFDTDGFAEDSNALVPRIPVGVSGTALAASLLRDGWSLAKMYEKYQEAVDALRHEQLGRKESEAILQRVLCELEEKAGVVMDEREEYEKMVESYSVINKKLQQSISEQANLEKTIQELKMDLRRHERDSCLAQKEIIDLQKQVTILLKECRDIQLRGGSMGHDQTDNTISATSGMDIVESYADNEILEQLLTFKDINGLVEQNVQLRSLVRNLSDQIENREMEFKEKFEMQLKKHTEEAESKVSAVLQRAEEQSHMIESLHTSVAMYKRLYEEEQRLHSSHSRSTVAAQEGGRNDLLLMLEGSQETAKKAQEKAAERMRSLEEDSAKYRSDIILLRAERDKLAMDANFAKERLDGFMKEFEHQRSEMNGILARNVEFSQLIVDYQRKLRENSECLHASEELSRKLKMEMSVLKQEKELLSNAEKRACDEVRSLSERFYRSQASLETIQSAEEVREESRAAERRKQDEYIKQLEREWAEAKKELQQERDNVRSLTSDRELMLRNAMKQVEDMGKELANALHAVSAAETRAAVAEAKLSDMEKIIKISDAKVNSMDDGGIPSSISTSEVVTDVLMAKEMQKLKGEVQAYKEHMLQYKSIAQVNETALKQMEVAHENFKSESEKLKESLEAEVLSLRQRISELDSNLNLKSDAVASAAVEKEEALASALAEINGLRVEISSKSSQISALKIQISAHEENLEKEHERWRTAQTNYERQVILQSETIQELTKTSQVLASLQQEASDLRKLADAHLSENNELKAKWEAEKSMLVESKIDAEKKYQELNEQNKILHSQLEALHIQLAEKDRNSAGISSGSTSAGANVDAGLQNVIGYLRRSKEIAETEISLLKQEKLRLQSQLDSALKAAETAQASLHTERTSSRALLFSEEEIKSLQLQVREMNLLRESNIQLREENKHNFEECQKLREVAQKTSAQAENLDSLLKEREIEMESYKKEIERERIEKDHLSTRVSELLERCRNIDLEDYNRIKDDVQQLQEKLNGKDAEMEDMKNRLSKQLETISKLQQDLAKSSVELNQQEKRINDVLQTEASLKLEWEKQKRLTVQWKRKSESHLKEKDELSNEKHGLLKQIEDLKQGKKSIGNVSGEQIMKEKEEKEHRIQILERTLERQREELKRERQDRRAEIEKRKSAENAASESVKTVDQERTNFSSKLENHKLALERVSTELEKLKHAEGSLPEGTSGTILDDLSTALVSAFENFEGVAHTASIETVASAPIETSVTDASEPAAAGKESLSQLRVISSAVPTSQAAAKMAGEKERPVPAPKTLVETRRTGRKLVRPRLVKPEEPVADVEMSDVDGSNAGGKVAFSNESDSGRNTTLLSLPVARKRQSSSASELNEEPPNHGQQGSGVGAPVLKKPRSTDSSEGAGEGQSAIPMETLPVIEESSDVADLPQGSFEESAAEKEEVEMTGMKSEPTRESKQLDDSNQVDLPNEDVGEEILNKPVGTGAENTEDSRDQAAMEDNEQPTTEIDSEREEGEMVSDVADDGEGADLSNVMASPEIGEGLPDVSTTPEASPARIDEEALATAGLELGEINPSEVLADERNEEGDAVEEDAEGSDKSNDGNDQVAVETDQIPDPALAPVETTLEGNADVDDSRPDSSDVTEAEEVKQVSPASSSTVVHLANRAREKSRLRQLGAAAGTGTGTGTGTGPGTGTGTGTGTGAGGGTGAGTRPPSSPILRGRGRSTRGRVLRGRVARGASGRGQSPSQQG